MGKFEGEVGAHLKSFIVELNKKISALEKEVENNNQIADLVLIQIKALFASSLAKIQFSPEVAAAQSNLSLITRDVLIPTKSNAGNGDAFLHP